MNEGAKRIAADIEAELRAWAASEEVKEAIAATEKAADADAGTFEVVITTENLDRYSEVIKLDGWDLAHYRANPIVLWGHDHKQLPIGVATSVDIIDGKMVAKGKFAPHPVAQQIRQLYDLGIVRATSVGFIEKEREGNLITKAELLEFSFVSVPANPYALSTLVKSGVSINEMVTKGFVFVKEAEAEAEPVQPAPAAEETPEPDAPPEAPVPAKDIAAILSNLKDAIVGLEALATKAGEPEPNEAPAAETEEQRQYREFSEKRRTLQEAATVLSEVLAEARRAKEAQH